MTNYELGKQWADSQEVEPPCETQSPGNNFFWRDLPFVVRHLIGDDYTVYYKSAEQAYTELGAAIRACREACAIPGELTAEEMREACAREAMSSRTHDYNAGIAAAIRAIPLTKEKA